MLLLLNAIADGKFVDCELNGKTLSQQALFYASISMTFNDPSSSSSSYYLHQHHVMVYSYLHSNNINTKTSSPTSHNFVIH